ncbi:MAG: hypothetical protein K8T25_23010 [Planctomycetia bacterium]|nr:hypothetical protein [Planctomycetia bacterium]
MSPSLSPGLSEDADLRAVVTAWPDLPATIRAAIVGLVKASGASGGKA